MSGAAACGAAIKADGYGLGAVAVGRALAGEGCRDFFVSNWREAEAISSLGLSVSVLHGVRDEDLAAAAGGIARPVLNTPEQVARWRGAGGGACDVMIDTGMNRLGVSVADVAAGLIDGLLVDTLMSHLARAEEEDAMNAYQREALGGLRGRTSARRLSLANSAGIALGDGYRFDLTRPGLALYGGVARPEMAGFLRPVVRPEAQAIQRRRVPAGDTVGYNATWTAVTDTEVAILNIGYADGYLRAFSDRGSAVWDGAVLPVIGRVSMDLLAVDASAAPALREGDWVAIDFDLVRASAATGLSQYELLTSLGDRYDRVWG
jgi:alanine racemase